MASQPDRVAPQLSIVMPAHNEGDYLEASVDAVVAGARAAGWEFEVHIVENGSTDATASLAASLAGRHREVHVHSCPAPDYGAALRHGFEASRGAVVVNFDVDYVDLGFAAAALAAVTAGAQVVIGTKRGAGAADRRSLARRATTAGFVFLLKAGFGLKASDTHGLKAVARQPVAPLVAQARSRADIFDTELVLRCERAGLTVAEIPVAVVETRPARTPVSKRIPRTLAGLARLRLQLWTERHPARPDSSGG